MVSVMNSLTESQIAQFKTEGYCIVPQFFNAGEIALMQRDLDRLVEEGLLRNVSTDGDGKTYSTQASNLQICPLSPKSEVFRSLPFSHKVRGAVGALIGDAFHLQLDQIFLKPGKHGAGTGWHQDNAYFRCPDPHQGVGMWVAVHDAHVANGTMHIVPRSHEKALEHTRDPGSDHHITCKVDEATDTVLPVEMKAGGALFFNYGIAHCTKGNKTDKARAGLALHFIAASHFEQTKGAHVPGRPKLSGEGATDGSAEYGEVQIGKWERLLAAVS